MRPWRIGILGVGKIARDQHLPALGKNPDFALVAAASRNATVEGVANYPNLPAMLEGEPDLDAVTICTPPQTHYEAARLALEQGKHVMLEKPPCATLRELEALTALASRRRLTLCQTWHSRQAAGVAAAKAWLAGRAVAGGHIAWKEDVRHWHPGQSWIWQAGGFGVFDPGINALSILTEILPRAVFVEKALLRVPANCQAPVAADLILRVENGARITAEFDFLQTGQQTWDIDIAAADGATLKLALGGSQLSVDGAPVSLAAEDGEYPALYRRFAALLEAGASDVDARPFQLVADAFLIGARESAPDYVE